MRTLLSVLCVVFAVGVMGCGSGPTKKKTLKPKTAKDKAGEEAKKRMSAAEKRRLAAEEKRRQDEAKRRAADEARKKKIAGYDEQIGGVGKKKAGLAEQKRVLDGQEKVRVTQVTIANVGVAVDTFRFDQNRFPKDLGELSRRPADVKPRHWRGPYYTGTVKDAWGNTLLYATPGPGEFPYEIKSLGEDGKKGGKEFAVDLTNHD
ncbi:MAG: type II secretion system protein GspG [Planctomycetota bacterium]|jgi:type II secretion system protein G